MSNVPYVSVIIPTLRRPQLLLQALRSVFNQTYRDYEVLVVVDGPDADTIAALGSLQHPSLHVTVNERSLTAAGARNVGVCRARGEWVAFLDDDDVWLPEKLERQLAFAQRVPADFVTCLSRVITPLATYVWPEVAYDHSCSLDEYLFDRKTIFSGASFIQTSSYLVRRAVFQRSPFRVDTPHDDWDFLIRLAKQEHTRVETVPEVLVELHMEEPRPSLSGSGTWRASFNWLESVRPLLTRRAYSGFCLGIVGPRAAREGDYAAFFVLLKNALTNGAPGLLQIAAFGSFWIVPQAWRRRLRAVLRGEQGRQGIDDSVFQPTVPRP